MASEALTTSGVYGWINYQEPRATSRDRNTPAPVHTQVLYLFLSSLCTCYFIVVNLPVIREQIAHADNWWSEWLARLFITLPILTGTLCLVALGTEKRRGLRQKAPIHPLALRIARSACWFAAFSTIFLFVIPLLMYLIDGSRLYLPYSGDTVPSPFPVFTFTLSPLFALILRFRHTFALLLTQTLAYIPNMLLVGLPLNYAIADAAYAMVFSGIFVGACYAVFNGLADLERSTTQTVHDRLATFELEAQLEENSHVNTMLHDYIIAVTVVVGRGLKVGRHALVTAAAEALDVLNSLHTAAPLTPMGQSPSPGSSPSPQTAFAPSPVSARPDDNASSPDPHALYDGAITARSFANLVGNTARSNGFRFRHSGWWTRIILSRGATRASRLLHRHPGAISGEAASAVLHAMAEAIRNSQRYAAASVQEVSLRFHLLNTNRVTVRIRDDGKGFSVNPSVYGLGIRHSLFARMKAVGGAVRIHSAPGHGCTVTLIAPLAALGSGARPTELRFRRPPHTFSPISAPSAPTPPRPDPPHRT